MFQMHIPEGFERQIHYVIPRHFLKTVEHYPLLHALFPTDIGWYPNARYHYRERPLGSPEHILIYCAAGSGWSTLGQKTVLVPAGHASSSLVESHISTARHCMTPGRSTGCIFAARRLINLYNICNPVITCCQYTKKPSPRSSRASKNATKPLRMG